MTDLDRLAEKVAREGWEGSHPGYRFSDYEDRSYYVDLARTYIRTLLSALPAMGLKIVPLEPTDAMNQAIATADWTAEKDIDWGQAYTIMVAAAPDILAQDATWEPLTVQQEETP